MRQLMPGITCHTRQADVAPNANMLYMSNTANAIQRKSYSLLHISGLIMTCVPTWRAFGMPQGLRSM